MKVFVTLVTVWCWNFPLSLRLSLSPPQLLPLLLLFHFLLFHPYKSMPRGVWIAMKSCRAPERGLAYSLPWTTNPTFRRSQLWQIFSIHHNYALSRSPVRPTVNDDSISAQPLGHQTGGLLRHSQRHLTIVTAIPVDVLELLRCFFAWPSPWPSPSMLSNSSAFCRCWLLN